MKTRFHALHCCALFGVLWVLLAAGGRCAVSAEEAPSPVTGELTRQLPVKVADAYDLRMLLVRLSLEAGVAVVLVPAMEDISRGFSSREGFFGRREWGAADALSAAERRVPDDGDRIFLLCKIRI